VTNSNASGNGARFLAAFNAIESHFRAGVTLAGNPGFARLLDAYGKKVRLTSRQKDELEAFADLRNAISHKRYFAGRPIAEPVDEVVRDIERMRDLLMSPPTALQALKRDQVHRLDSRSPIADALALVKEHDISQLPVYDDGGFRGLLTTNAIARWLAAQFADHAGLAEAAPVSEVLEFAEPHETAELCGRNATVLQVLDLLAPSSPGTRPVAAVIISHSGRRAEQPLGIVVALDLPRLYASIR
jgi:CBS domain-containing protein